ncbi:MAG: PEP/pyruvate-binding domain-containing protein [Candidatus Paceibacterota bacterium]
MDFVRRFSEISKKDTALAGGKGASLGEMMRAGIPVPNGYVVLADAFELFLEETKLRAEIDASLDSVDPNAMHTIEQASEKIQALVLAAAMPADIVSQIMKQFEELDAPYVAVRSSATAEDSVTAAWAGQLDTFLNTTEATLLQNVQRCWASLFTPRAIFYRFEKGLQTQKIGVAVVVQKMVESETSGIAFSVHPVTEDSNQLIVEAGYGLGEAIVSGAVTPDSYVVEKVPRRIVEVCINTQTRALHRTEGGAGNTWRTITEPKSSSRVLSTDQILRLADIVMRIERLYGFPCDIEWAYENGGFYITQSRPITTLGAPTDRSGRTPKIDADDYYLNFKVGGYSLPFVELITAHYDPSKVLALVDGAGDYYSFYSLQDERQMSQRASEDDFVSILETAAGEVAEACSRLSVLGEAIAARATRKDYQEALDTIAHLCAHFGYFNNAYLDTLSLRASAEVTQKVGTWKNIAREHANDTFFTGCLVYPTMLRDIERQLGVVKGNLDWHRNEEILALLDGHATLPPQAQEERKQGYGFIKEGRGKQLSFVTGTPVIELLKRLYENKGAEDVITGITGHATGQIVRGKVCLIKTDYANLERMAADMAAMESGDVLVSQTTAPELMPAFYKASAVVTDIGGLLSHAAITSRELGLPCVVGTKNASERLQTGDLVEVDADNGIVRILKTMNKEEVALNKEDYILTFWARGVSPLVVDINTRAYARLEALCMLDHGLFKQYFKKSAYTEVLNEGLAFYADENAPTEYQIGLRAHCCTFQNFFDTVIRDADSLSVESIKTFLAYSTTLFGEYNKMNYEYTNKAFLQQDSDPVIAKNLEVVTSFKDEVRAFMNEVFFDERGYVSSISAILSGQFALPANVFANLTQRELLGLFAGQSVGGQIVSRQTGAFVVFYNEELPLDGQEAQETVALFEERVAVSAGEVVGQTANKGKARGKVRTVLVDYSTLSDVRATIEAMSQGDILVAETTAPELLFACKKAGAIVTDMGGLMSHAAIVSRELNIPCIVGTSIGSKVLKDGDLIEVDADRGVVTILKRA